MKEITGHPKLSKDEIKNIQSIISQIMKKQTEQRRNERIDGHSAMKKVYL